MPNNSGFVPSPHLSDFCALRRRLCATCNGKVNKVAIALATAPIEEAIAEEMPSEVANMPFNMS
eukprot:CAMPEP_0172815512 /NCGR_PEP_ID=MMETSP1075-20121228/11798_1 /TAXON_ID=2916 /ORGANISM="Ceratium fusus, Strain PA161109" /LENGTH=63 /DNA_ID=CAMNT_0013655355 /DNA_START=178 /DNA_END=369 /DNA_ORIENTATION=-